MCCVSRTVPSWTPGASANEPSRGAESRSGCSPRQRGDGGGLRGWASGSSLRRAGGGRRHSRYAPGAVPLRPPTPLAGARRGVGRPRPPRGAVRPGDRRGPLPGALRGSRTPISSTPRRTSTSGTLRPRSGGCSGDPRQPRARQRPRTAAGELVPSPGFSRAARPGPPRGRFAPDVAAGAPGPGPDHRVCGSTRRPQGRRRPPRGRGRPEQTLSSWSRERARHRPRCTTVRRVRTWPDGSASSARSRPRPFPRSTRASTFWRCPRGPLPLGPSSSAGSPSRPWPAGSPSWPATARPARRRRWTPACWCRLVAPAPCARHSSGCSATPPCAARLRDAGLASPRTARGTGAERHLAIYRRVLTGPTRPCCAATGVSRSSSSPTGPPSC